MPRGRRVTSFLLIEADEQTDVVVTYPLNTTATSPTFLQPKYETLRTITFEGFKLADSRFGLWDDEELDPEQVLQRLPSGFVKDPYFGLGLNFDIRYIAETVEKIAGVTDIRLRRGRATGLPSVQGPSYLLSARQFDDVRKVVNRIHGRALTTAADEKWRMAHNSLLTPLDSRTYPAREPKYRKDAVRDAIGARGEGIDFSKADQKAIVSAATAATRTARKTEPALLLRLSREIEVVTLEELLDRFEAMLEKNLNETTWQTFFSENPFVLRLAFGHPIAVLGGQTTVGGHKFDGTGGKISDFAVKAAASGNLGLVEIKTPATKLIEERPYRGDLHAPGREFTGAINQILDQRYKLQKTISALKDASGRWDVETYAVQGVLIIGRLPEGAALLKSFELFRNALKSISVITFDELAYKLQHLLEVLRNDNTR
ncbi:uncharacterized protein DUF4263 [Bradyrhizobium stylosanthis]|uniref:Uncharacterized protein DUF4263 n=1 Tax=Bradyrhizobium stylosanthis TaxID=1803665 RepID=A0A560CVW4_9BRAD|nr:uncharacterized protein DUF4263 [Bradyrhizobium stylosanthis]